MKRNKENRNIRVLAKNNGDHDGFIIYLDFSGRREYLKHHRHNGLLYETLKDGIALDDIKRWRPPRTSGGMKAKRNAATRLQRMVGHLITVIDEYMLEREAC